MGWLELLPLLKRLLPLLSRVAPMLETMIAARGGTRAESEAAMESLRGDIHAHLADSAGRHDSLAAMLEAQNNQVKLLTEGLTRQRATDERTASRLLEIEAAVAALGRTLRLAIILLAVLIAVCLVLFVYLLLYHSS